MASWKLRAFSFLKTCTFGIIVLNFFSSSFILFIAVAFKSEIEQLLYGGQLKKWTWSNVYNCQKISKKIMGTIDITKLKER